MQNDTQTDTSETILAPLTIAVNEALDGNDASTAFKLCEDQLAKDPDNALAHRHLGLLHAAANTKGSAISSGKRACTLTPDCPKAWSDLGRIYAMLDELDNAVQCFNESIEIDVKFADGWHNLGVTCKRMGKRDLAFTAFKNALLIDNARSETYLNMGTLLTQAAQYEDALVCFERAVERNPTLVTACTKLGYQMSSRGKVNRAESLFRQSLTMNPDHLEGWLGLGRTLEDMGEAEGALAAYLNVLKRRPDHPMALGHYLSLLPAKSEPEAIPMADSRSDRLETWQTYAEKILRAEGVKDDAKSLVGYGLTKFHNRRKNYQQAAEAGLLASDARRRSAGVLDRDALVERIDNMINTYTVDFFQEHSRHGMGTDQPVFIVGLPRSGTTLTEQILSAHPDLYGAGELPDLSRLAALFHEEDNDLWQAAQKLACQGESSSRELAGRYLKALREGARKGSVRISDKSPLNFFQLPLAAILFPNARVVHCYRNARDNALSIWMENFNLDQQWSTDFDDLAFFRKQYRRLMAHWEKVLPLRILDMPYEETVADLEGQARRLIDFLDVQWDEQCLSFHKHERAVQTPSRWQVRQPIYTKSVERWRAYEDYLPSLITAFED